MADTNKKPAENPDLEIQEIIQGLGLPDAEKQRVESFFKRDSIKTITHARVNLEFLKKALKETKDPDKQVLGAITMIATGTPETQKILQEAEKTKAWQKVNSERTPEQPKTAPEKKGKKKGDPDQEEETAPAVPAPAPKKSDPQKAHGGNLDGGIDDAGVSLSRHIDNLRKDPRVSGNPVLMLKLKNIEKDVQKGINIENARMILKDFGKGLSDAEVMDTMPGVVEALRNFEKTDTMMAPDEGKAVFFISIVRQIYALRGRLVFLTNNDVEVKGAPELKNFIASCKPKTKEWLKKGLILNSTQASTFMSSMGSDMSKLTVDTFVATNKDLIASNSPIDADILSSSKAGGFNVTENGVLIRDGFNIGKELQTTQDAIERMKKIGVISPMQKIGGAGVQIADLAYNVVKVGFVAGTIWKGTKAVWKTIFGDEAAMKEAWGEFGKTAAWTAGIWYGGELVKRTANTIVDRTQNGEFEPIMKGMSPHHSENVWAIWDTVGGGIVPERIKTANIIQGLSSSTVEWHIFRSLITDCFSDRNSGLSRVSATKLADAVGYRDHTSVGSHVGDIRKLLTGPAFGPDKGEEMYLKYFGNRKTAEQSYKILRAIANYRSSGPDAIDRRKPLWTLFAEPLKVKPEVPFNVEKEMEELKESLKGAGVSILESGIKLGTLGATGVRVAFEGIEGAFDIATDTLKHLTPAELGVLKGALAVLGLTVAGAGVVYGITLIPGFAAAKVLAITAIAGAVGYGGYKLIDTAKGLLDDPDKLIEFLKKHGPQSVKDIIAQIEGVGKPGLDILKDLQEKTKDMNLPDWVQKPIDDMLKKLSGASSGGTNNSGNSDGAGTGGAGETPSTIPTEL
ncbi:MAG: hypothetical protein WC753_03975 [Candidatus Gracilibacteria bacterium]